MSAPSVGSESSAAGQGEPTKATEVLTGELRHPLITF